MNKSADDEYSTEHQTRRNFSHGFQLAWAPFPNSVEYFIRRCDPREALSRLFTRRLHPLSSATLFNGLLTRPRALRLLAREDARAPSIVSRHQQARDQTPDTTPLLPQQPPPDIVPFQLARFVAAATTCSSRALGKSSSDGENKGRLLRRSCGSYFPSLRGTRLFFARRGRGEGDAGQFASASDGPTPWEVLRDLRRNPCRVNKVTASPPEIQNPLYRLESLTNRHVSSRQKTRSPMTRDHITHRPPNEANRTMPPVGGFSRGSPVPPPFPSGAAPYFTLIVSQDLDGKSRPNLLTLFTLLFREIQRQTPPKLRRWPKKYGNTVRTTSAWEPACQPAAQPTGHILQHVIGQSDARPIPIASRSQSENRFSLIKVAATPFRLCVLSEDAEIGVGLEWQLHVTIHFEMFGLPFGKLAHFDPVYIFVKTYNINSDRKLKGETAKILDIYLQYVVQHKRLRDHPVRKNFQLQQHGLNLDEMYEDLQSSLQKNFAGSTCGHSSQARLYTGRHKSGKERVVVARIKKKAGDMPTEGSKTDMRKMSSKKKNKQTSQSPILELLQPAICTTIRPFLSCLSPPAFSGDTGQQNMVPLFAILRPITRDRNISRVNFRTRQQPVPARVYTGLWSLTCSALNSRNFPIPTDNLLLETRGIRGFILGKQEFKTPNRVRFPAGSLADLSMWESCRTMPLVGGFSWGSSIAPPLHSDDAPYSSPSSALKNSMIPRPLPSISRLLGLSRVVDYFSNVSAVVAAAFIREEYLTNSGQFVFWRAPKSCYANVCTFIVLCALRHASIEGLSGDMAAIVAMDTPRKKKGLVRGIENEAKRRGPGENYVKVVEDKCNAVIGLGLEKV
ncbi:hypothetical protein PR048_013758, partial [Dryococelus australis]